MSILALATAADINMMLSKGARMVTFLACVSLAQLEEVGVETSQWPAVHQGNWKMEVSFNYSSFSLGEHLLGKTILCLVLSSFARERIFVEKLSLRIRDSP